MRGEEQLDTALCIRRVDPTSFRTYCAVASNHFRTSTFPVALHRSAYWSIRCSIYEDNLRTLAHIREIALPQYLPGSESSTGVEYILAEFHWKTATVLHLFISVICWCVLPLKHFPLPVDHHKCSLAVNWTELRCYLISLYVCMYYQTDFTDFLTIFGLNRLIGFCFLIFSVLFLIRVLDWADFTSFPIKR